MAGSGNHFTFDLDRAIFAQVTESLKASPTSQLIKSAGPTESGIYALYYKSKLVYIGKASKETTKSGRTLRQRLNEHVNKITKHQNIQLADMAFRYLTFESEWWVFAAEHALISRIRPEWNYSGFGSKTPGRGRPGTERVSTWDSQFPPKPATHN